jgi:hypothetical protein
MRKTMTKEVTKTIVKVTEVKSVDGQPVAERLEDVTLLGNVSLEKAQRIIAKEFAGRNVTVFDVETNTQVYELPVEEFIKIAEIKEDSKEDSNEQA